MATDPDRLWAFPCCGHVWDPAVVTPSEEAKIIGEHLCAIHLYPLHTRPAVISSDPPPATCRYRLPRPHRDPQHA